MNDTVQPRTVFLQKDQLHLAHTMIRVCKGALSPSGALRSLEGKVLACRMSRYNGHSYALQLTEAEMKAMRCIDVEYCARMGTRVKSLDQQGRQSLSDAVQPMLSQYQYITRMMGLFSSL